IAAYAPHPAGGAARLSHGHTARALHCRWASQARLPRLVTAEGATSTHDALMERPGNLTKAEREMIVVAHRAILRIRAKNPLISDQVAINYQKADITERQKAMLDVALKVSRSAETAGEADFDVLKSHGLDEEDIWDIAAIAAFFGLSNRIANVTAMRPNAEFYTMGRS